MEKPAQTNYPVHDLIRQRWSPLAFGDRFVTEDTLKSLFEAARWAASCFNEQPWRFIVASKENPAEYEQLLSCLVPANQRWAKTAPVLMVSIAKLSFTRNGNANRFGFYDTGLAMGNFTLQAESLGLRVHQMGGFDIEKTRSLYNIPEDFEPIAAIACGYPGDDSLLEEDLRERAMLPRDRKPFDEMFFRQNWENSYF
jgi:nitroreductase